MRNESFKPNGFTLIEVMVALMILAVVAITASQASTGYIRTVEGMKTRTLANFVAQNMGEQLKINEEFLTVSKNEQLNQQGRDWQVTYTPSEPPSEKIVSININVAEMIEGGGTGTGSNTTVFLYKLP